MANDNVVSRATSALAESVASIIGSDADDATKHSALAETFSQFETYLRNGGGSSDSVDHHASTVADLLTEAGTFPHRTAALHYLLNKPGGRALLSSLHKAAETEKGQPMESLTAIMKDIGPIGVAKQIVATGRAFGISEAEYVAEASRHASALYGLPGDRAFAKLCSSDGDVVRACSVLKAREFDATTGSTVYPMPRSTAPGRYAKADPVASVDSAYAELQAKAAELRKTRPELSEAQAFAAVYTDRGNVELAKRERAESAPR
jgi:hypothetical protein